MAEDLALKIPLQGDVSPISHALDEMKNKVSASMTQVREAMGAVGIMAAGYLAGAVESAEKAQESTEQLKVKIENQGESWNTAKGQVDQFTKGVEAMSLYSKGDAKAALDTLITRHVSMGEALKDQTGITELAAAKNISLKDSADMIANAENGRWMGLEKLGVVTKEEVKNGISMDEVNKRLNSSYKGLSEGKMNSLPGQITLIKRNFSEFTTSIGQLLLPTITKIGSALGHVSGYLTTIDAPTKKVIASVLVATAGIGLLVGGLGIAQRIFGILGPTIKGAAVAIGGLTWPIAAIIAAIALFTVAYTKNFGGFKTYVDGVVKNVVKTFGTIVTWVKTNTPVFKAYFQTFMACIQILYNQYCKPTVDNMLAIFKQLINWVKANWHFVSDTFGAVLKAIPGFYNTYLKPVLEFMLSTMGQVVNWIRTNWPLISNTIKIVMQSIWDSIQTVMNALKPAWQLAWNIIKDTIGPVWNLIKDTVTTAINIVENIIKLAMDLINGNWKGAWTDICNLVKTIFGGATKIIGDVLSTIGGVFKGIGTTALGWGADMIGAVINGIKSKVADIIAGVGTIVKAVTDTFHKLFDLHSPSKVMFDIGSNVTAGLINGLSAKDIGTHVSEIISGMKGDFNSIRDFFNGIGASFSGGNGMTAGVIAQIKQAMTMLGVPMKFLGPLETIANHESSGNTSSINLTDSNARAGHPSQGLFQMIPSTFQEHMVSGYGNITNGLDNTLSAIRYMISRYHGIENVPGLVSLARGGPYIGYETGSLDTIKGLSWKGEKGPELSWSNSGDGVLSSTNSKALLNIPGVLQDLTKSINKMNDGKDDTGKKDNGIALHVEHLVLNGYNDVKKLTRDLYNAQQDLLRGKGAL